MGSTDKHNRPLRVPLHLIQLHLDRGQLWRWIRRCQIRTFLLLWISKLCAPPTFVSNDIFSKNVSSKLASSLVGSEWTWLLCQVFTSVQAVNIIQLLRLGQTGRKLLQNCRGLHQCKDRKYPISVQKCNWLLQVAADSQHSVNQPLGIPRVPIAWTTNT